MCDSLCVCVCMCLYACVCMCVCVYVCVNVYELLHEVHVLLQRRSGMHVVHVVRGRGEPGPTLPSSAYQYTLSAHISLPPHSHLLQFCFPLLHGFGCASSFFVFIFIIETFNDVTHHCALALCCPWIQLGNLRNRSSTISIHLEGQIPFHNLPGKINCDIVAALLFLALHDKVHLKQLVGSILLQE